METSQNVSEEAFAAEGFFGNNLGVVVSEGGTL